MSMATSNNTYARHRPSQINLWDGSAHAMVLAPFSPSTPALSSSTPPPLSRLAAPSKTHCASAPANLVFLPRLFARGFPSSVSSSSSIGLSWCRVLSSTVLPAAGVKIPSSRLPTINRKMRSSFSERSMNRGGEASASLATNDHDKLLHSENGGKDNEKLNAGKPLPISDSKFLTLPTILTLGRMAAIPILLVVFYSTEWWASKAVAFIFVSAAITDWLDGFLARKMGSNSTFGAFLDPVADKLMVATTLVLLSTRPLHISWAVSLPWLIPLPSTAIIGREITMSAVREWAASQGENLQTAVAVNKLGKWKTAFQMVALTVLLATRNESESGMVYALVSVGVALLYISAALAIWSLFVYMRAIWGALAK